MRRLAAVLVIALVSACSTAREYPLTGQVLFADPSKLEITVKHEDIPGFMPGMTMPFRVSDKRTFDRVKPGDLITATLVVEETSRYLAHITTTGSAPLPPEASAGPRPRIIEPGTEVPDVTVTDQGGNERRLSGWRGKVVAVTFVYTRCPLPNFCPLMDRHFATVQRLVKADSALAGRVQLLSVSFDPDYDTPSILQAHATRVGADPVLWSYVTGTRDAIDPFARVFGVAIMRWTLSGGAG